MRVQHNNTNGINNSIRPYTFDLGVMGAPKPIQDPLFLF
jgi:hypothetical protein